MTQRFFDARTPLVTVIDNRGLAIREIGYHRHPDTPDETDERITRHTFDARGCLAQSTDPRLHQAGLANFTWLADLSGNGLYTISSDAGTSVALSDAAGRPLMTVSSISTGGNGRDDFSQSVTNTFEYEGTDLPGRLLSVTEQAHGETARITERFVYAGHSQTEKGLNLAGQCIRHYDTAGRMQIDGIALSGVPLSVSRCLLKDADSAGTVADWQGEDASAWNDLLDGQEHITLTTADGTGAMLTTTDAKGNLQRVAYDVAGQLSGSWLTVKDGKEQVIVSALTYSAAGQKLREVHGNGVVTTYEYEPETQRLSGIKTERPAGHASGATVLQDLRYQYDPVGNVLKVSNDAEETRFWRNQKVVPENTYIYDSLYQLASASGREMANAGQQGGSLPAVSSFDNATYTRYTRTYSYDRAGNLTRIRHSAPAIENSYTTDITVSDRSNRGVLSTLTANPADVDKLFTAGGQQKQLQPGQRLNWTPRGELLQVTPVVRDGSTDDSESYRYDADSQRLLKVSVQKMNTITQTQRVTYMPGLELRSTTSGSMEKEILQVITLGEGGRAQVRVLHWESGRPDEITGDQTRYSYGNLIGSSSLELDGDGDIISTEEYYPYGGTAVWTARNAVEANYKIVRYSGKERDATGLYYYGYRYYQPWAGRWLSADPAGMVDGLNLYAMVTNNPVTFTDSDGLSRTETINNYAEWINTASSSVSKIHTYLDALGHPKRMIALHGRSATRKITTYAAKTGGALGGFAAGAAIGLAVPVIAPVTAIAGAAIGGLIGGKASEKGFDLGVNHFFKKNKFQSFRVQTRKMNKSLKQVGGNFFVNLTKNQLDKRDLAKDGTSFLIKKGLDEATGIGFPVNPILDTTLEVMDSKGLSMAKKNKIEGLLDFISEYLSDVTHNEIMDIFDEKGKNRVREHGTLKSRYLYNAKLSKDKITDSRNDLLKRIGDVRRMLNNPAIYTKESAVNLMRYEASCSNRNSVSRRHSI